MKNHTSGPIHIVFMPYTLSFPGGLGQETVSLAAALRPGPRPAASTACTCSAIETEGPGYRPQRPCAEKNTEAAPDCTRKPAVMLEIRYMVGFGGWWSTDSSLLRPPQKNLLLGPSPAEHLVSARQPSNKQKTALGLGS